MSAYVLDASVAVTALTAPGSRAADLLSADDAVFQVPSIFDAEVLSALRGTDIEDLIRKNKVSGGMILKLEAAKRALAGGVSEVRIVGGTLPKALVAAAGGVRCPGTRVLPVLRSNAKAAHGAAQ